MASAIDFVCLSESPSAPDSGRVKLYADSSCSFNVIDSTGNSMPVATLGGSQTIDEDYTVLPTDYSLRVTGARIITVPDELPREFTIYAADSVVTLSVTPENEPATIPAGSSYTLIWDATLAGYYVK